MPVALRIVPRGVDGTATIAAGAASELRFRLQHRDVSHGGLLELRGWRNVSWEHLVMTHGARAHVNVVHSSGRDLYHLHALQGDGETLVVPIRFRRPGTHMVAVTWVIEFNRIGLCADEYVPHAHGVNSNRGLYPLLEHNFVVDVAAGHGANMPRQSPSTLPVELSTREAIACAKRGQLLANDALATRLGFMAYEDSFAVAQSAKCCNCSSGAVASHSRDTPVETSPCGTDCARGGGCMRVRAYAWPLGRPRPAGPWESRRRWWRWRRGGRGCAAG